MRRAARVDDNHAEIRDRLRDMGYQVYDIHGLGGGLPDLMVVSRKWVFVLLEVKTLDGSLTDDELRFFRETAGAPRAVVRSLAEAESFMRLYDYD